MEDTPTLLTEKDLRKRGWSERLCRKILKYPDAVNDEGRWLYSLERIEGLESFPEIISEIARIKAHRIESGNDAGKTNDMTPLTEEQKREKKRQRNRQHRANKRRRQALEQQQREDARFGGAADIMHQPPSGGGAVWTMR